MKFHGLKLNDNDQKVVKVRVANSDTKMGKSNGYRIIYYAITNQGTIFLLTIYYKKDNNKVPTDKEIVELVKKYVLNVI